MLEQKDIYIRNGGWGKQQTSTYTKVSLHGKVMKDYPQTTQSEDAAAAGR